MCVTPILEIILEISTTFMKYATKLKHFIVPTYRLLIVHVIQPLLYRWYYNVVKLERWLHKVTKINDRVLLTTLYYCYLYRNSE